MLLLVLHLLLICQCDSCPSAEEDADRTRGVVRSGSGPATTEKRTKPACTNNQPAAGKWHFYGPCFAPALP